MILTDDTPPCKGVDCPNKAGAMICPTCLKEGRRDQRFCSQGANVSSTHLFGGLQRGLQRIQIASNAAVSPWTNAAPSFGATRGLSHAAGLTSSMGMLLVRGEGFICRSVNRGPDRMYLSTSVANKSPFTRPFIRKHFTQVKVRPPRFCWRGQITVRGRD
jgi:zf-MYND-like zinc finger, mRNA-binding